MQLTEARPWLIGWRSVRDASLVQRLQRGGSPYMSTVDRVRGWMHVQPRGGQRRAATAAVTGEPSVGTALPVCPAPAVKRRVRSFQSR